ncbi:MAG: hypothetical protein UE783_01595, partial [Prevotella sp.]|nr:hypothetical protein [Prevotella sp.]
LLPRQQRLRRKAGAKLRLFLVSRKFSGTFFGLSRRFSSFFFDCDGFFLPISPISPIYFVTLHTQ